MYIKIDFHSGEALYLQLCNQIILGIATSQFREGEALPSVRQLAQSIGINMHTVNKAYTLLKQEGYLQVDRRRGAVIAVHGPAAAHLEEVRKQLEVIVAKCHCRRLPREQLHQWIDGLYDELDKQ